MCIDPKNKSKNAQKSTADDEPSSSTKCTDDRKMDEPTENESGEKDETAADTESEKTAAKNVEVTDTTATDASTSTSQKSETEAKAALESAGEAKTDTKSEPNEMQDQKDSTCKLNDDNSATTDDTLIDIEDPDDYLLYLESILTKIHTRFYALYDETKQMPDLKSLLPKIRNEVLLGTTLVFSGLVPTQIKLEKSKAYLIARSLGASVTQQLTDETTHLVASTASTFKVNAARKMSKIHIVSPDWLWTCAERWECVEERLFPLDSKKASKTRQPPAHCHSPGKINGFQR